MHKPPMPPPTPRLKSLCGAAVERFTGFLGREAPVRSQHPPPIPTNSDLQRAPLEQMLDSDPTDFLEVLEGNSDVDWDLWDCASALQHESVAP